MLTLNRLTAAQQLQDGRSTDLVMFNEHLVGTSLLCFYFYPLCYAAVLLKFTYYAQEQELLSDYYAIYIQFCISNSLHVVDNFYKDCFIGKRYQVYHYALSYYDCSIGVYRSFTTIFHKC